MSSSLQLVMEVNSKLLTSAKVTNVRGCSIDVDRQVQKLTLIMKGSISETRVHLPREDRPLSSLRLHDSLLVAQICLDALEHFALEVIVSQSGSRRTKLIVGTHIKSAQYDENAEDYFTVAYLPLIIPRNKWVQVVFHVDGIVRSVFALPAYTCIDSITVAGTGRVSAIYVSSDEQACIDATPESMALFAVPAYAPPIWKSAAATIADDSVSLPAVEAASSAPAVDPFVAAHSSSRSASLSPLPPPQTAKPAGMPLRLQPLVSSPLPESASKYAGIPAREDSARVSQKCEYIRLVDDECSANADNAYSGPTAFGDAYQQAGVADGGGRRGPASGPRGGIGESPRGGFGGWEQTTDERKPEAVAAAPGRPSKAEAQRHPPPRRPNVGPSSGGAAAADNERMQRLIAARKRQVSPRLSNAGAGGGGGSRSRSTGSRRQQRLRRRMRALRANEQKVNRAAAAKTLMASEIPLTQHVEPSDDFAVSSPTSASDAPLCGFGFGYLGVLKDNGEYEEDEDAHLNLRGALTLNSDGE